MFFIFTELLINYL